MDIVSIIVSTIHSTIIGASGSSSCPSADNSGTTTPVRKISAHEFERSGCFLRPMVSTTLDGTPTFLQLPGSEKTSTENLIKGPPVKTRQELESLNERELIFELVKDICNDLDVRSLCHKILKNVSILTNADRCSLFLVFYKRSILFSSINQLFFHFCRLRARKMIRIGMFYISFIICFKCYSNKFILFSNSVKYYIKLYLN